MATQKFKGTLVAVDHGKPLDHKVRLFTDRLRPNGTLFIEGTPEWHAKERPNRYVPPEDINPFRYISHEARENGKRVVFLDDNAPARLSNQVIDKVKATAAPSAVQKTLARYVNTELRERKWRTILRNAKPGDVVVVHPGHAWRMAPTLGVSRLRVKWVHLPDFKDLREINASLTSDRLKQLAESRLQARRKRRGEIAKRQPT